MSPDLVAALAIAIVLVAVGLAAALRRRAARPVDDAPGVPVTARAPMSTSAIRGGSSTQLGTSTIPARTDLPIVPARPARFVVSGSASSVGRQPVAPGSVRPASTARAVDPRERLGRDSAVVLMVAAAAIVAVVVVMPGLFGGPEGGVLGATATPRAPAVVTDASGSPSPGSAGSSAATGGSTRPSSRATPSGTVGTAPAATATRAGTAPTARPTARPAATPRPTATQPASGPSATPSTGPTPPPSDSPAPTPTDSPNPPTAGPSPTGPPGP